VAKKKGDIDEIDRGWLVYANFTSSDGKYITKEPHYALVLSKKAEIDVDDLMLVAPISTNRQIADAADMVAVDPSYGLARNSYVICSWNIPELHRNAVVRAHRPGVNCDAFMRAVLQKLREIAARSKRKD
jgi:mRNA-degrading endonuclease toxin of MazEF toxin-antitoxin module